MLAKRNCIGQLVNAETRDGDSDVGAVYGRQDGGRATGIASIRSRAPHADRSCPSIVRRGCHSGGDARRFASLRRGTLV